MPKKNVSFTSMKSTPHCVHATRHALCAARHRQHLKTRRFLSHTCPSMVSVDAYGARGAACHETSRRSAPVPPAPAVVHAASLDSSDAARGTTQRLRCARRPTKCAAR
ncbi:hypothetical protein DQ04_04781060, partial [Trypanosoma grayi]|uniref:hypothetical protein n=1 Tax=Trypanosoma grayi TaxID=71804 RepID=UPI0004F434B6